MVKAGTYLTILELNTENNAEVNPATTPRKSPSLYWKSKEKITYKPNNTTRPSINSNFFTRVLLNQGSSSAAHREFVANPTRLTETFAILADPKNATQWKATMKPMRISLIN